MGIAFHGRIIIIITMTVISLLPIMRKETNKVRYTNFKYKREKRDLINSGFTSILNCPVSAFVVCDFGFFCHLLKHSEIKFKIKSL